MSEVLKFTIGKLNKKELKFHYLRIGKAAPLLDNLREDSEDNELEAEWIQHEAQTFQDYHYGSSYEEYDGTILNLGVNDENIAEIRRQFWEYFIWKTQDRPQLLAIVVPDYNSFGSLSKGQLIEALSLVRLTDRPFKIFENKKETIPEIVEWLTSMASVVHRKHREETEEQKLTNR